MVNIAALILFIFASSFLVQIGNAAPARSRRVNATPPVGRNDVVPARCKNYSNINLSNN
jgi:hypothetical protein